MTAQSNETDTVTRIIKECHTGKEAAEKIFQAIAIEKSRSLQLSDGPINISEEDAGEFVQRYSAEVETTLWESKRRKN